MALLEVSPNPQPEDQGSQILNLTPSSVKNPPNFMTLLNQDVLEAVPQNSIMQSLQRVLPRGDKLLTGQAEENLDMMFTELLRTEYKERSM